MRVNVLLGSLSPTVKSRLDRATDRLPQNAYRGQKGAFSPILEGPDGRSPIPGQKKCLQRFERIESLRDLIRWKNHVKNE